MCAAGAAAFPGRHRRRRGGDDFVAQSMAPFIYARPNTVGKFTDLPVFMWYESCRSRRNGSSTTR